MITLTNQTIDTILAANNIVIIDFWAEWCQPCRALNKILATLEKEPLYKNIIFARVNIVEEKQLLEDFAIQSVPTLMIFNQKIVIFRDSGPLPIEAIRDLLNQALKLEIKEVKEQLKE